MSVTVSQPHCLCGVIFGYSKQKRQITSVIFSFKLYKRAKIHVVFFPFELLSVSMSNVVDDRSI